MISKASVRLNRMHNAKLLNARVVVPSHVLVREVAGQSVFLNLDTERYLGLDAAGTKMWNVLVAAPTVEAAYQKLLETFDVDAETLRTDFEKWLDELGEQGLIEMRDA